MKFGDFENFGVYNSDHAYDNLATVLDYITERIRKGFAFESDDSIDTEDSLYGGFGEGMIMANIDIALTLCNHYRTIPYAMKIDEVKKWKADYLHTFDKTRDEYDMPDEYNEGRRKVISKTFDDLIKLLNTSHLKRQEAETGN